MPPNLKSLLSFHLLSKFLTFFTTIIITRLLPSPSLKGHIFTLTLFKAFLGMLIGREAFYACFVRLGITRRDFVLWIGLCAGLLMYLSVFYGNVPQLQFLEENLLKTNMESRKAFVAFIVAIIVELIAEPIYVHSQHLAAFDVRMRVEGVALFMKCVVMYLYLQVVRHRGAELGKSAIEWAFVYSELAYAFCVLFGYLLWNMRRTKEIRTEEESTTTGKGKQAESATPAPLLQHFRMLLSFYVYDIFRFILTEGEKYALVWFSTLQERGVYDVVFNLGSLVVRLVFQPIEQVAFTTWSRILHQNADGDKKKRQLDEALFFLRGLLKFLVIVALTFVCFGPPYSFSLFRILYGSSWLQTEAPFLMQVYCVYVGFVALNGVSEAFVRAAADNDTLRTYSIFMTLFSVIYVLVCAALTYMGMGTVALIVSNCVNMLCRITYNAVFIQRYFAVRGRQFRVTDVLPHRAVLACFATSLIVCKTLENSMRYQRILGTPGWLLHIALGGICFVVTFGMLWLREREFLRELKGYVR